MKAEADWLRFVYSILADEHLGDKRAAFERQARDEIMDFFEKDEPGDFTHVVALGDDELKHRLVGRDIYMVEGRYSKDGYWECRVRLAHFANKGEIPMSHPNATMRGKKVMIPEAVDAPGNNDFIRAA